MVTIRVMIAEDHPLVAAGIAAALDAAPDIVLVAITGTDDIVNAAAEQPPDVIVVDPPSDRMDIIGKLTANAAVNVLVLSENYSVRSICEALLAGAGAYFLKANAAQSLAAAVRAVSTGGTLLDPAIVGALVRDLCSYPVSGNGGDLVAALTVREKDVLVYLAQGFSDAQIARRIFISPLTVRTHVGRVLTKLAARNRAHAVTTAYRLGLIRIPTRS